MKAYRLNLKNIEDFKKYAGIFEISDFRAVISDDSFSTDASDIIELFCHWPYKHLTLTINELYQGNFIDIEDYLERSGLLVSKIHLLDTSDLASPVINCNPTYQTALRKEKSHEHNQITLSSGWNKIQGCYQQLQRGCVS